jgi:tetratricopeptide (TPR) repeat protein
VRKEGYTDFKGNFEFELGKGDTSRDVTESGRDVFQNSGNRGPTQGMGSDYGVSTPGGGPSTVTTRPELLGCELRASLPGYRSSSVILRADGNSWDFNVGTILLSRLENVKGSTISTTTMAAPAAARRAFEKGEKALAGKKLDESEKELRRAVEIYPAFAKAWAMLGDVHRQQNKLQDAREDYGKGIAADSQFVNPYFGMAVIAIHEKNWEEALKYSNRVTEINAAAFSLNYMYNAAANYHLGNLPAAEASAHKFKELDTDHQYPDSCLLLSNILLAKRDYDGAARELEDYLRIVPAASNAARINEQIKQLHDMRMVKQ